MLDDYDIGGLLGKGGFAHVYRGRKRGSGREVAIKIVSRTHHRVIQNEIALHQQCSHPNIIQFMESFEDDAYTYIILECCKMNLFKYLKVTHILSELTSGYIIKQILTALEYLHSINILHRDIKLSNILISAIHSREYCNIDVKLSDFGLAIQSHHPDEEQFTLCGTPHYIAPGIYYIYLIHK